MIGNARYFCLHHTFRKAFAKAKPVAGFCLNGRSNILNVWLIQI